MERSGTQMVGQGSVSAVDVAMMLLLDPKDGRGGGRSMQLELDNADDGDGARSIECFTFCVEVFFHTLMRKCSPQAPDGGQTGVAVSDITLDALHDVASLMPRAGIRCDVQLTGVRDTASDTASDNLHVELHADGWTGPWDTAPANLPVSGYRVECALGGIGCVLRFEPQISR